MPRTELELTDLKKVAVIIGSPSRAGLSAFRTIQNRFGADILFAQKAKKPSLLARSIDEAIRAGAEAIAIGGGDGTLRLAAPKLIQARMPLIIIPCGTGNALARELGVPLNPIAALEFALNGGSLRQIDVGRCNDQIFLTSATCGLSTAISQKLENVDKGKWGRLAYLPAILRAVREAQPLSISVQTDTGDFKGRIHQFVATASRTHAGPFRTSLESENDDGLLSIYAVEVSDRASLLRYGLSLLRGVHTAQPNVWAVEAHRADVQFNRTRRVVLDGDRFKALNFRLRIEPGALSVFGAAQ